MNRSNINFSFVNFFVNCIILSYLTVSINLKSLKSEKIYSYSSIITLKIIGPGINSIFSTEFQNNSPKPNYVDINNINQKNINNNYNFTEIENTVKLTLNNGISNCQILFKNCINITHIDFSNFDFSSSINANYMFSGCSLLKEIIFPSKTIKLIGASGMFYGCKSLSSLVVSNFDVSSVINFSYMFKNCESLTSLYLSNFNKDSSCPIKEMFANCKNLEYIDFGNKHYDSNDYDSIFLGTRNLVVCHNCDGIRELIDNKCITYNCNQNWKSTLRKYDIENNRCIDYSCATLKKYDSHSKCYTTCPTGTYTSGNYVCNDCHPDCKSCNKPSEQGNTNCNSCSSPYKYFQYGNCISKCKNGYYIDSNDPWNKICKCDKIKCFECSKESLERDLCISCNEGYYQKYEEKSNYKPYINCYKLSEEYYLDIIDKEKFYKKCYQSCKICNKAGNEQSHNCIECKPDYYYIIKNGEYKNCYMECPYYFYFDKDANIYYCTENVICPENYNKLILENKKCVKTCDKDNTYKYEFQNRCYQNCPEEYTN